MAGVTEGHGRYRHWVIDHFDGGYIDGIEDSALPDTASKNCRNVISKTIGSLESRGGQQALNAVALAAAPQGLYSYYYGSNRRLIIAHNGSVGYWDFSAGAFVSIATGGNTAASVLFETCVNYLVGMDGVGVPWKWDGTTFSALADAPAKGKLPVLHKEKLFCVDSDAPSTLVWSSSFAPETWPGVNHWDITKGDGDVITALHKFVGELIIFKRRSTHTLKGTSLDDMSLQEIDSRVGCVGPLSLGQKGIYLYVVGEDGIYLFNGMKYVNLTSVLIPKLWARINQEYIHKAVVTVWEDAIWFSLPLDDSTINNFVLVYHMPEGSQSGSWWPWDMEIGCFTVFGSTDALTLYTGHSSLGYILKQDVGRHDDNLEEGYPFLQSPIYPYWESKKFNFEIPGSEKKTKRAFVEVSQDTSAVNPHLIIGKDYGEYDELILERADSMVRQYRFINSNRWRYMSVRFEEVDWAITLGFFTFNETLNSQDNSQRFEHVRESVAYCSDAQLVTANTPVYEDIPVDPAEDEILPSIVVDRGFIVKSIIIPFKSKTKPKVREGIGGMGI